MSTLTKEMVEQAVPANLKSSVTQSLVDQLNNVVSEPEVAEMVRTNFVSYAGVLRDGKFKTEDYLHAVTYVSFKLMGLTSKDAYARTFPNRYAALVARGVAEKDISGYVAAYNRGKLVNLILEQSLTPSWVLNQDVYQEAINTQAVLMRTAQSEKVRSDAADSLLNHLKKPEGLKAQINIDLRETSGMNELKDMLRKTAEAQQDAIRSGVPTRAIAATPLIGEGPVIEGVAVHKVIAPEPEPAGEEANEHGGHQEPGKKQRSGLFN